MPTEVLLALFITLFCLTGIGLYFAFMLGISSWLLTEAGIERLNQPLKLAYCCNRFRFAFEVFDRQLA